MFSNPQEQGSQRISADEAKQLIRSHQNREAELQNSVTVQDMSETLNLPTWQVQQMVAEMRSHPTPMGAPMAGSTWLKTQLWKWVLAAIAVISFGPGLMAGVRGIDNAFGKFGSGGRGHNRATVDDGIYDHDVVMLGRSFGMKSPPGFSYKIKYGTVEAAANGDSEHYVRVKTLSEENVAIAQEQYTEAILDGFGRAILKAPPEWVDGKAIGEVKPNYYPGGLAKAIDITLDQKAFETKTQIPAPVAPPSTEIEPGTPTAPIPLPDPPQAEKSPFKADSPEGKAMHDRLLQAIQEHWRDITH